MSRPSQPRRRKLLEKLRGQADLALDKLGGAAISGNPSIKGASREEAIREFMRCFLPRAFAIGHGEIFSADNDMSKQVDVIIYDDLFSPVFRTDDGGILVPCEAVYGTAEVKTRLDRDALGSGSRKRRLGQATRTGSGGRLGLGAHRRTRTGHFA